MIVLLKGGSAEQMIQDRVPLRQGHETVECFEQALGIPLSGSVRSAREAKSRRPGCPEEPESGIGSADPPYQDAAQRSIQTGIKQSVIDP